jgi:proteasome lid subunit RPN8/RPN11
MNEQVLGSDPRTADAGIHVVVPTAVLDDLRVHAADAYPEECCGILVGRRDTDAVLVQRGLPCSNAVSGAERRSRFAIHPRALLDVIKGLRDSNQSVVGFYHSHPDAEARLSATDLTFVGLWPETVWLVLSVGSDGAQEARAWWLPSAGAAPRPLELPLHAGPTGAVKH